MHCPALCMRCPALCMRCPALCMRCPALHARPMLLAWASFGPISGTAARWGAAVCCGFAAGVRILSHAHSPLKPGSRSPISDPCTPNPPSFVRRTILSPVPAQSKPIQLTVERARMWVHCRGLSSAQLCKR